MFSVKNEDSKRPPDERTPPAKVVSRSPILSVRQPATVEKRNVVPMAKEPIKAVSGILNIKDKEYNVFYI